MSTTTAIVIALSIAALAGLLAYVIWRAIQAERAARPVAIPDTPFRWHPQPEVDATALQHACLLAVDGCYDLWDSALVLKALSNVQIVVMPEATWETSVKVGGASSDGLGMIWLPPSFDSLMHECIHLCQTRIDHLPDPKHTAWMARGFWAADNEYRAALKPNTAA